MFVPNRNYKNVSFTMLAFIGFLLKIKLLFEQSLQTEPPWEGRQAQPL